MWWLVAAGVSHFSMVGFPVDMSNAQTAGSDFQRYAETCEPFEIAKDKLLCVLADKSGAELWIGIDKKDGGGTAELSTLNPAFRGQGKATITVDGDVSPAEWKPYEIRVQAQFASGIAPLIIDLADPREAVSFVPKAKLEVDITAFADEVEFFGSEKAYYDSQASKEIKFAANHFIPSGMFNENSTAENEPRAHALFAGEILQSELRENSFGKARYWWILVRTLDGAVFNVVADPSMVKSKPIVGGILSGSFWLSARLSGR